MAVRPLDYSSWTPRALLGLNPGAVPPGAQTTITPGIARSAGPGILADTSKPWHPDSPMFWFGVLLATTFGLIGASTSLRVGPFKAAASAGKS
jgi:hypothetical protein